MKGVVFNLLEEVVIAEHGEDAWDDLLDAAGMGGSYTSLGSYADEDMYKLVGAAARHLNVDPMAVLRWFGQKAMPLLARRYPAFFEAQTSIRPFLLSLNSIIHPEVRKIYPGADVPVFDFEDAEDGLPLRAPPVRAGAGLRRGRGRAVRRADALRAPEVHAPRRRQVPVQDLVLLRPRA